MDDLQLCGWNARSQHHCICTCIFEIVNPGLWSECLDWLQAPCRHGRHFGATLFGRSERQQVDGGCSSVAARKPLSPHSCTVAATCALRLGKRVLMSAVFMQCKDADTASAEFMEAGLRTYCFVWPTLWPDHSSLWVAVKFKSSMSRYTCKGFCTSTVLTGQSSQFG